MLNLNRCLFLAVSALVASSCATIFSGTTQMINVQIVDEATNEPLEGVQCRVTDGKGLIFPVSGNPGQFTATKGNGPLTPSCKKEGYVQTSFGMGESFNGVTLINVLFWPGFIVDGVSGAMKDYPSHMTIMMKKSSKPVGEE